MQNHYAVQINFLKKVKDIIPPDTSLVDELAEVLSVSNDSVYRRMRGETALTVDELVKICKHFKISFDSIDSHSEGNVSFRYDDLEASIGSFTKYLQGILTNLQMIAAAKEKNIIYATDDVPIFRYFQNKYLADFKCYYWIHSVLEAGELKGKKYTSGLMPHHLFKTGHELFQLYNTVASTEILTHSSHRSTLAQIRYCWEAGLFADTETALSVCEGVKEMFSSILQSAECSNKNGLKAIHNYDLYISDIEVGNNCIIAKVNNSQMVFLRHNTFNSMSTMNERFCNETAAWLEKVIQRSTLISSTSEKHRMKYFSLIERELNKLIAEIKN